MEQRRWTDTAAARRSTSRAPGRDERRRTIVDAAIAAIEEHGPEALTGQIADRAGLARSHVYRHFASKEELDLAVARRAHDDLTRQIRAALEIEGSPRAIIRAPIAEHVGWASEHPNLYIFLLGRNYRRGNDEPRIGGSAFASEISAAATRYIPEFGADPLAADRLVVALLGLIDASVRWWLVHREMSQPELVDQLTTEAWLLLDHRLRSLGIQLDAHATLPDNG
ncbi:TetR/AcrR family transcriptional regulator [Nocardia sp. NPDC051756]|uniref:TetR/AcrR family transcriptional regulator n=1 Tax=Nocardia sp. NPDC051756 TaxID=3154751 RepID=UPI003432EE97